MSLLEPTEKLDVISITGMPGLGKTTLAWKIYNNEKVCREFERYRIWVDISEEFNIREVLKYILEKLASIQNITDEYLAQTVCDCLANKRFLLVMDDVWNVEDWNKFSEALPHNNSMGKVLITSRENTVGRQAIIAARKPHELRFLTEEESWELLQLQVFGNPNGCPDKLEDIGKRIARQCDRVPLTIMVIGGILKDEFTKTQDMDCILKEWYKVSDTVGQILKSDKKQQISSVVELSYNRLPDYLIRECFLYLGVFPEDHEIPAWTLTRLWIAEGFVEPKEGKSLEESAEDNLNELIDRNLLRVDKTNMIGEVKTCRVHDMIRAYCRSKAEVKNLFQEIKITNGVLEPPVAEVEKFRRVCFHSDLSEFLSKEPNGPHVRSFLCFYKEPVGLREDHVSAIPDGFKLLRVLESKSTKFPSQFSDRITELIHLRYITLHVVELTTLPEQLSKLWNLQTLVVETGSPSIAIKANIWRMFRLRHLKTKAAIVLDIKREGKAGENLQTLSRLSPESFTDQNVSKRARNLNKLGFRGKIASLFDGTMSLTKMERLEKLKLINDLPYEPAPEDRLSGFPASNFFPPNLKSLTLSNTLLKWKHMATLANIDTLEVLKLKDRAFEGVTWTAEGDGFHSLKSMLIVKVNLVIWEASANPFPKLKCLVLKNCKELMEIPPDLGKKLEKLEIAYLGKSAVKSARRIEEDKKKQEQEQQQQQREVRFKLCVGPGCEEI